MTVLVTGAAGFLGSHVTDLLLEVSQPTRALIRPGENPDSLAAAGADVRAADIRDASAVTAAVRGVDLVVHCAARTGPWGPRSEYEQTNVHALQVLVQAAMSAGVRRIVHVSSIAVHGTDIGGRADENAPMRREPNPYSQSKVAGERLIMRLIRDEGARVTIVRPGWIYGPRDHASFARFCRLVERGQMIMIGPGTNHLPLVYVSDVAQGILRAGAAPGADGRSYLLVSDQPVTQRQFLTAIARELSVPTPARHVSYRPAAVLGRAVDLTWRLTRRGGPPPVTRYGIQLLGGENGFETSRARSELGFSPEVGYGEGVRRGVEWYRTVTGVPTMAEA